jgi:hypothetical protein
MPKKEPNISTIPSSIKPTNKEYSQLKKKILRLNAIALSKKLTDDLDMEKAINNSNKFLETLNATGSLQEMIAAQLLSIHRLQQISIAMANNTGYSDTRQYFTNTAIKLTNCFTQQASLLAKLQGSSGHKIVVEHVDVHQGGQAIVGLATYPTPREKK